MLELALRFERRAARFGDDLVEPPIKPGERFANAIGRSLIVVANAVAITRCRGSTPAVRAGEPFEMTREFVEAIVDSGEIFADRLLVVLVIAM